MKQRSLSSDIGCPVAASYQQASSTQHTTPLDDSSGVFAHLPASNNGDYLLDTVDTLDAPSIAPIDAALFAIAFSITGMPSENKHPANISDAGSLVWNKLLASKKYLDAVHGKTSIQAWAICTKMFLDLCHRKGVTPFRTQTRKPVTLKTMTADYARYRSLCSSMEQQVCKTLGFDNLVESVDRGVWKFSGVEYKDKRFVIVLQTKWLAVSDNLKLLMRALKKDQFEKIEGTPGVTRSVSAVASVRIRIQKFPYITLQMRLQFSKDKLLALGIQATNTANMLADFEAIARYWTRTHKFVTLDVARKQPVL